MPTDAELVSIAQSLVHRAKREPTEGTTCLPPAAFTLANARVGEWAAMLQLHKHDGRDHWHLTANRLSFDGFPDWSPLTRLVRMVQLETTPEGLHFLDDFGQLTPPDSDPPGGVYHWAWHGDGTPLDATSVAAFNASLRGSQAPAEAEAETPAPPTLP